MISMHACVCVCVCVCVSVQELRKGEAEFLCRVLVAVWIYPVVWVYTCVFSTGLWCWRYEEETGATSHRRQRQALRLRQWARTPSFFLFHTVFSLMEMKHIFLVCVCVCVSLWKALQEPPRAELPLYSHTPGRRGRGGRLWATHATIPAQE